MDLSLEPVAAHSSSQPSSARRPVPGLDFGYEHDCWRAPQLAHLGFDRYAAPAPNLTETLARLATSPYPSPTTVITVSGTGPTKVISVLPASSRGSRADRLPKDDEASVSLVQTSHGNGRSAGRRGYGCGSPPPGNSWTSNGEVAGASASIRFSKTSPFSESLSDGSSASDTTDNSECSSNEDSDSGSSDSESGQGRSSEAGSSRNRDRKGGRSGSQKRRRIVISDEKELRIPIEHGWRRQTKIRTYSFSGARGEVIYFAPCGKKLKTYPEVIRYLDKHGITDLIRENFSFSAKHNIGEFLDPQEGGKYVLINEHEVLARIEEYRASKGRKYYYYQPAQQKSDQQRGERHRKKEEMKHQMRLEEQAAELRRQKEHLRFLKQQEKVERQEQIRAEKEMRTQQLLEEKELKKQKAVEQREQERERRRQHMILVKALEVRKKQEERERLKEEKNEEKRLIKEKKMEQKRIELQIIREMKKPVEDMELADSKTLPLLERINGVRLPGKAFADILMVYEFIHNFGETLGFDMENMPTLNTLQSALLNDEAAEEELVTILHHLLTCAIVDPGMPPGQKNSTMLGQSLKNVDITSGTVSEVLRIFIQAHDAQDGPMQKWIVDKPFMALNPTQKSTILAFLCNELLCSRNVCRQIDNSIELASSLRRDKWVVEGNIRKMRSVQMRKMVRMQNAKANKSTDRSLDESGKLTGDAEEVGSDNKEKGSSVNEGEDEDYGKNDSGNESDGSHRTAQGEVHEGEPEEEEEEPGLSPEEIEKKIDRLSKQMNLFRRKLTKASQQLRALSFGQDRYKRRYWLLPRVGGVLVESMESGDFVESTDIVSTGVDRVQQPLTNGQPTSNDPPSLSGSERVASSSGAALAPDEVADGPAGADVGNASPYRSDGPWFSLLPRTPCDETTLTRIKSFDASAECSPGRSVFGGSVGASSGRTTPCLAQSTTLHPTGLDCGLQHKFEDAATRHGCRAALNFDNSCDELRDRSEAKPIPKEFRRGWWRVADANQLRSVCQVLHPRGIREKMLQKQLEKYLDIACEACNKPSQEALILEVPDLDKETPQKDDGGAPEDDDFQSWSYETALRVDLAIVEQVEALEERVASASMQVKSWKIPPKITEEDGIKFRPVCVAFEADEDEDEGAEMIMCPLDVAKERLLNLEAAIERRYLKPPLGHGAPEANVRPSGSSNQQSCGTSTSQSENGDAQDVEPDGDSPLPPPPQEAAPGLVSWRSAVLACKTSSQLALCLSYLENTIAWDRSIMKASCQFCNSGDNEGMLLLCDGCDRGYHTYCFRPKMECIPDGDWFCYECVNKAAGDRDRVCVLCGKKGKILCYCDGCPKAYHIECMDPPLTRMPKNRWFCWQCGQKNAKGKSKKNDRGSHGTGKDENKKSPREQRTERKNKTAAVKDLAPCRVLLSEMESHEDAWPFLLPVNTKHFPTYRKIIKKPMDLNTVKTKIAEGQCKGREDFVKDVRQIFDNCEIFNEDDSPVGKAGHNLRAYFETRWMELTAK